MSMTNSTTFCLTFIFSVDDKFPRGGYLCIFLCFSPLMSVTFCLTFILLVDDMFPRGGFLCMFLCFSPSHVWGPFFNSTPSSYQPNFELSILFLLHCYNGFLNL